MKSSTEGKQFTVPITDWFFHPDRNVDIAAVRLNGKLLREQGLSDVFFPNDVNVANKSKLESLRVSAGDGVLVLGFTMSLAGA